MNRYTVIVFAHRHSEVSRHHVQSLDTPDQVADRYLLSEGDQRRIEVFQPPRASLAAVRNGRDYRG